MLTFQQIDSIWTILGPIDGVALRIASITPDKRIRMETQLPAHLLKELLVLVRPNTGGQIDISKLPANVQESLNGTT